MTSLTDPVPDGEYAVDGRVNEQGSTLPEENGEDDEDGEDGEDDDGGEGSDHVCPVLLTSTAWPAVRVASTPAASVNPMLSR